VILLFTDFGLEGPYLGEMTAALRRAAPEVPVVNLMADAPPFRPDLAAYLLAAVAERSLAPGDVLLGVVDPGVGGSREPLALRLDGRWAVGPDNGLFELMLRRCERAETFHVAWLPALLSASFHGRDLFAPVAARLARGERHDLAPAPPTRFAGWPDDLPAVLYIDRFGNALTGLRAATVPPSAVLRAGDRAIAHARTFCEVEPGQPFWYANSAGLVEVAVNAGSAATLLGLELGTPVTVATMLRDP
jgi:S-adenosyl-L-methionine hydrolase (adenosine-forming)